MKVLIVARTRLGDGACVWGIAEDGRSVRWMVTEAAAQERAGLAYEVHEVWEVESIPDPGRVPPHVENIRVQAARRLKRSQNTLAVIRRWQPPVAGAPGKLFDGLVQASGGGALYIAEATGLPGFSAQFWRPDQPLQLALQGRRIRYRYPTPDGGCTLAFAGFQEPLAMLPAGTLLRISLAHWWRPKDHPEEELRCYLQVSGWFLEEEASALDARPLTAQAGFAAAGSGAPPVSGRADAPPPPAAPTPPARDNCGWGTGPENAPPPPAPRPAAAGLPAARQVLKETFGFSEFLPLQAAIISRVLERQDTLAIMPTGGGKSLCYQLPALLFEGLTVVVSPLIALMQDQVSQLQQLAVPAAFLNSSLPPRSAAAIASQVREGRVKVLYLAPESLLRPESLLLLEQSRLACLAVDEAHCISEWGHDFRPEYRQIQTVRKQFASAVCVALTATATPRVRDDIRRLLAIPEAGVFAASFNRPNLFLAVQQRRSGLAQILDFLKPRREQSGIVYCATRKQVEEITTSLNDNGFPSLPYHAGLGNDVRRSNQDRFLQDEIPIMVATVAFGMGINKSNVRYVVHFHLPKDIESYYQEIGRGGRDGLPADCLLLYRRADAVTIRHFIEEGADSERPGRQARLNALLRYAEARECRRAPLLGYFGETLGQPCGGCDLCRQAPATAATADVTVAARKFLSCVQRTGELFGPAHLIAILRGSRSERVLARGHDRLSTYGIGAELSAEAWRDLAQQFIQLGLVDQDLEHGGLRLAEKGWEVLRGTRPVSAILQPVAAPAAPAPQASREEALFQLLRAWRLQLAAQAGLPAYIVFSDRTLAEMASLLPQTEDQLLAVNGVGRAKLANYGAACLEIIRGYCREHGLAARA